MAKKTEDQIKPKKKLGRPKKEPKKHKYKTIHIENGDIQVADMFSRHPKIIATPDFDDAFSKEMETHVTRTKIENLKKEESRYFYGLVKALYEKYNGNLLDEPVFVTERSPYAKLYTPKEMFHNVMKYFQITIAAEQPFTLTGTALYMGLSVASFNRMCHDEKMRIAYPFLSEIYLLIQMYNEYATHKKQNPAGPIFILKNMGWSDRMDINVNAQEHMTPEERTSVQRKLENFSE